MNRLVFIAVLSCLLTSCLYTKNAAIRKFCVSRPINIDSSWVINGEVLDSSHVGSFELVDSCNYLKNLYDSLIRSGNFVIDTNKNTSDTPSKNSHTHPTKWAKLYNDSVFTIMFRLSPDGKAQFDIKKHERKIHYKAQANFKQTISQPCPPQKTLPWWHTYVVSLFWMLVGAVVISCITHFIFKR